MNSRGSGVNDDLFIPLQKIYNTKSYMTLEILLRKSQYRTKEYAVSRTVHMEPIEIRNKSEYRVN